MGLSCNFVNTDKLVEAHGLGAHLYADDTQLYGHCSPSNSLSWRLEFFELLIQLTRGCPQIGTLSTQAIYTIHLAWSELSTGHFSWTPTRPDSPERWPDPTRPAITDRKSDPTRPAARPFPNMYSLQLNNYIY